MRNPVRHRLARSTLAGALLALGASALGAQTGTIAGRVTDARTNGPLAQATVLVEGTRLGASAGQDGAYRIALDQLLTNGKGESRISAEDYAVALVDEIEAPRFVRQRFTVAY